MTTWSDDPQPRGAWAEDDDEPARGDRWALVIIWALVVGMWLTGGPR